MLLCWGRHCNVDNVGAIECLPNIRSKVEIDVAHTCQNILQTLLMNWAALQPLTNERRVYIEDVELFGSISYLHSRVVECHDCHRRGSHVARSEAAHLCDLPVHQLLIAPIVKI